MLSLFAEGTDVAANAANQLTKTAEESGLALKHSFENAWTQIVDFTPRVLAAVIVLVAGYFIARLVAHAITVLCDRAGLQRAAERSGLSESMSHMNIRRTVPSIIGTIVFWMLMLVFLMAGFSILEIPQVSGALNNVVNYIPNLLVATVVVVVGLLVASFFRGVIATSS